MATTVTDPSLEPDPSGAPRLAPPAPGPEPDQGTHHRGEPAPEVGSRPGRPRSRRSNAVNMLFGRKIRTDQEMHERLGNSTALAVFASDALSSVAYATEEMLTVLLIGGAGALAFGSLLPLSLGIVALLVILVFSYRQTIKAYPSAGGAYIVTRDNFGVLPAQVAGVALLTDYILTVAVSVSAGTAAIASAWAPLRAFEVPVSLLFIAIIAFGNLRGVKESGRIFAVPTYFFILNMVVLLAYGIGRMMFGDLPVETLHHTGMVPVGNVGTGLLLGASLFKLLTAFANG